MLIQVRLFATLRQHAGRNAIELDLTPGATVGDAVAAVAKHDGLEDLISRLPLAMAVNREYASADYVLGDGDELALVPPVSGGADDLAARAAVIHVSVTSEPLSVDRLTSIVADPRAGATVIFQGMTREVERLEYEAYDEMAEQQIWMILTDVAGHHDLIAAAAEHRVGSVPLGESSVVVAVSAAHRGEAFAGAREAIDRIKAEAPIWKQEISVDADGVETATRVAGTQPNQIATDRPERDG